jgi:hypothetical protein
MITSWMKGRAVSLVGERLSALSMSMLSLDNDVAGDKLSWVINRNGLFRALKIEGLYLQYLLYSDKHS